MVQPRFSHSTPPPHVQPHYEHPGNADRLSPRSLAATLDSWNDAVPSRRRSPSPMSPSAMESFVNKAKAMLRGKRNSVQAAPSDFAPGKLEARRITSHYQPRSSRPPPQRQATAPLPTRRLTKSKPPRPPLKNDGSYVISNPITSNTEATYKYCELVDTADMAARTSRHSRPREHLVRSPSPPQHSAVEPQSLPTGRFASSQSVNRTSTAQDTDSPVETLCVNGDTAKVYSFRPRSDVFPLSVTASSSRSQVETSRFVGLKDGVLATFDGYESHESLTECHAPFEYDCLTPTGQDFTGAFAQEPGFGVSETIRAISNAGMLDDSGTYGFEEELTTGLDQELGDIFATDEGDYEADLANNCETRSPPAQAWLGTDVGAHPANQEERSKDFSRDIVDEYLDFGEDTLTFSMRARERNGLPTTTSESSIPEAAPDTPQRTVRGSSRPVRIAQCLESMTAGGTEALLTPWRAQLDPTCRFIPRPANERRSVEIVTNSVPAPEQSTIVDLKLYPSRPAAIEPLRITKPLVTRSRSRTLLSVPVSASPPASMRRSKTGHARRVMSSNQPTSPSLWEPVSAPPTTTLFSILDPHPIASSSRTPSVGTTTVPAAAQGNTMARRRRNTREMFLESQVAHVMKGSRGAGVGGSTRSRYRVPAPYKSLEPARSLKQINTKGLTRGEDEENSADWLAVSPTPTRPSHILPKSPARRALYVSPPKSSRSLSKRARTGNGTNKSPLTRGGMVKSPSVRSGLAKSGMRRGLSASQSRSGLHASPSQSRNGVRTHVYGSSSPRARFPKSPSTRSLPGSSQKVTLTGPTSPLPRPPRSGVRPPKTERRRPGFWDGTEKENVPAGKEREGMGGFESPLRSRAANAPHFGFGTSGSLGGDRQTACSHTPSASAPESPRRRKQDESDMMCTHAKALVAEIMNGHATLRGPGAPIVPARSPARPRTYNLI